MRKLVLLLGLIFLLAVPAHAAEITAPAAPDAALELMPDETDNFGEGLLFVLKSAFRTLHPSLLEAVRTCVALIAVSLLIGILSEFAGITKEVLNLIGAVTIAVLLFQPVNALIKLGTDTVNQISQYGRLLLPVMTGGLAAQGAVTKSSAIYMATAFFDALLTTAVSELLIPMVYIFLCVAIGCHLFSQPLLDEIRKFMKWLMTWGLKIILYLFTGYIAITGVVGGTTDAAMLKATKLTISGMVPVVGNILSDASEAVLVGAGMMKNAAGIYGLLVVAALWIGPFLQIGVQYVMLKVTAGIVELFGTKQMSGIMKDFSSAMGIVLAMTGTVCLIFMISTVCFMKGVST